MTVLDEILPAPTLPRDHMSATSLGTFARCPEQFRRRYMLGERERPGAAMVWGSADHYAHEQNFRQKIESHEDLPVADVELAFAEGFDQTVERDGGEREIDWKDEHPGGLKDKGIALVAAYHREISPTIQPVQTERQFTAPLLPGLPPIQGRIDVETETRVIEGKTASRKGRQPHWLVQAVLYRLETGLPFEWHVKTKTKVPAIYTPHNDYAMSFDPSRELLNVTAERMLGLWTQLLWLVDTYGPDEPWPSQAPEHPWACNYCGFRVTCHWWAGA